MRPNGAATVVLLSLDRNRQLHAEQVDFDDPDSWERSMDDLILKAAIW